MKIIRVNRVGNQILPTLSDLSRSGVDLSKCKISYYANFLRPMRLTWAWDKYSHEIDEFGHTGTILNVIYVEDLAQEENSYEDCYILIEIPDPVVFNKDYPSYWNF